MVDDHSYRIAWEIAQTLGSAPEPEWLSDSKACINTVKLVEANVSPAWANLGVVLVATVIPVLDEAFEKWAGHEKSAPGISDPKARKNVVLRLWAGCAGAGKMIDRRTMNGPTSKDVRAQCFKGIDAKAAACPVYRAGVSFAYDWKASLGQAGDVTFEGLPVDHLVRRRYNAKHGIMS